MNARMAIALVLFALALGGCNARSISNSGYPGDGYQAGHQFYRGEIDELDLIVPVRGTATSQAAIDQALAAEKPLQARRNEPLLVVQSGAIIPDEAMTRALGQNFRAAPFAGLPPREEIMAGKATGSYGERLRTAAANGGFRQIFVYWGMLETAKTDGVTKAVSWVPIVGYFIPDESQRMRIRLKGMLIDVASGRWRMYLPTEIEDSAISAALNRVSSDQGQVAELKAAGYQRLADMLAESTW